MNAAPTPPHRRPVRPGLAIAAIVATLAGCGEETATPTSTTRTTAAARPRRPPSRPRRRSAGPVDVVDPAGPSIPADFPLADGLPEENEDQTPVEVTDEPGVSTIEQCDETIWTTDGAADVAGALFTQPEDSRARTLALYGSPEEAQAAFTSIREGLNACPSDTIGGTEQVYEEVSTTDNESLFTHRFRGEQGFDVGLEVIQST